MQGKTIRGSWYASFYYTDWQGTKKKKKKEGFKTKKEALEWEKEFLSRKTESPEILFKHLVNEYLEHSKTRIKESTLRVNTVMIKFHILPFFENIPINEITTTTIAKWQDEMLKKGLKDKYLSNISMTFSTILNFAIKYYKLASNPIKIADKIGKSRSPKKCNFWTLDEFNSFITNIEDPLHKICFQVLFWTGIRVGELLALTYDDIDFNALTLTINKTYYRRDRKDVITTPKTRKSIRSVSIPKFLCENLKQHCDKFYSISGEDRLFLTQSDYLLKKIKKVCNDVSLKQITVHDLRHSHASLLIEKGFQAIVISERLGHENIQTTLNIYSHLYPNTQNDLAKKLDELNKK